MAKPADDDKVYSSVDEAMRDLFPNETTFPPNADVSLGLYALSLKRNDERVKPFTVDRAEWSIFGGELCRINGRRVGGRFATREEAAEFCRTYTAENPGCASEAKALGAAGVHRA